MGRIVPFFQRHPLITAKQRDFELFCEAMALISSDAHLRLEGLCEVASLTERMNRELPSRFLESSEAIRQPPQLDVER